MGTGGHQADITNGLGALLSGVDDAGTSQYHCDVGTTVTLDDDIREAALCYARATGQPLGRVLSDMARHALMPDPQHLEQLTSTGCFPSFEVLPGTRLIPASRIQRAIDEDGIV